MNSSYTRLKNWFLDNYGHLGFDLSPLYQDTQDLKFYFGVLYNNNKTEMVRISLERVLDFTVGDKELRKLIFDTLLTTYGYRLDGDFTPIKKIKQFEL
jgi:hypothetical protein